MITLYSILFGLAFGSFANVCIYRLPLDKSVIKPRSFCPGCKRPIRAMHNIPVISFLFLRGRCAGCQSHIAWRYPLVELTMASLFVFHSYFFQDSLEKMVVADILAFHLLTLSIIDFHHLIIPDELSFSLIIFGLGLSFWNPYFTGSPLARFGQSALAGFSGGALMLLVAWLGEKAFRKEALGGGDVKLIAGTAAVLGGIGIFGPLMIGSMTGGIAALFLMIAGKKRLGESLPFGPFLSLGAYVACLIPTVLTALFRIV